MPRTQAQINEADMPAGEGPSPEASDAGNRRPRGTWQRGRKVTITGFLPMAGRTIADQREALTLLESAEAGQYDQLLSRLMDVKFRFTDAVRDSTQAE